ncbi:MAG: AarF/ABC1/UbiB kinase family protein [Salibacteraceae bacterium]
MRLVCEELGPTFIKFGQLLSNRPDLLPKELIIELEKLQDKVPPFPTDQMRQLISEDLKQVPEVLFKEFYDTPFASASIAQVHKAVLQNGNEVVLKIQRPGIRQTVIEDIQIMLDLVDILIRRVPSVKAFDPKGLIQSFEESILREMDFINESVNIQRFRLDFKDTPEIYVPAVYRQFTTQNVLTLEFINGIKVSDYNGLHNNNLNRKVIAKRIINLYYKQVFDHGFFHADPHAGNILILPDNVICFIDFGMMGSVLKKDIDQLATLFIAIGQRNIHNIIRALQQLAENPVIENPKRFEYDLNEFVNTYAVTKVHNHEMSTMINSLRNIVLKHKLQVPSHFFLLSRSMIAMEGVVRHLDPSLKLMYAAQPHLVKAVKKKLNPIRFAKGLMSSAFEMAAYLEDLPGDLKETIRKIKSGKVKVDLEHKGIDPLIYTLNRISKQIVAAVIVGSLIVGSSLIILSGARPHWWGISALGVLGLSLAAIVAFGMVSNLRKNDKGY